MLLTVTHDSKFSVVTTSNSYFDPISGVCSVSDSDSFPGAHHWLGSSSRVGRGGNHWDPYPRGVVEPQPSCP